MFFSTDLNIDLNHVFFMELVVLLGSVLVFVPRILGVVGGGFRECLAVIHRCPPPLQQVGVAL